MSFVKDVLFGKKGTPAQVVDTTPSQFTALRAPVASGITDIINTGGGPAFEGPMVAGLSDQERSMIDRIFSASESPVSAAANPMLQRTLEGEFLSPESNPFLQAMIDAAVKQTTTAFNENVMPRLRGDFTKAGQRVQEQGSSPFDMAAARASSGLADAVANIATTMGFQNFENERQRQMQAASQAPVIEAQQLDNMVKTAQAVALPRLVEQFGIDRGMEEFQRRIQTLLNALQIGGQVSQPSTVTMPGTEGTMGIVPTMVAGAAGSFGGPFGEALAGKILR